MGKTISYDLGGPGTPPEIRNLRESSYDFHQTVGQPVIFKHRWNEDDLSAGLCQRCPLHDPLYGKDSTWDEYCFGTGYVGGYSDGQIVYMSISDAQEDVIKFDTQGVLMHDQHPRMTAPWLPTLGDGDLIIVVSLDHAFEITDLHERYELKQVVPVTVRGPYYGSVPSTGRPFRVNQTSNMDRLPFGHQLYGVPVTFDYSAVPSVTLPPNYDPSTFPAGATYSETSFGARIRGAEQTGTPPTAVPTSETTFDIRIKGGSGSTHITF